MDVINKVKAHFRALVGGGLGAEALKVADTQTQELKGSWAEVYGTPELAAQLQEGGRFLGTFGEWGADGPIYTSTRWGTVGIRAHKSGGGITLTLMPGTKAGSLVSISDATTGEELTAPSWLTKALDINVSGQEEALAEFCQEFRENYLVGTKPTKEGGLRQIWRTSELVLVFQGHIKPETTAAGQQRMVIWPTAIAVWDFYKPNRQLSEEALAGFLSDIPFEPKRQARAIAASLAEMLEETANEVAKAPLGELIIDEEAEAASIGAADPGDFT
jgi:hypothetical protein